MEHAIALCDTLLGVGLHEIGQDEFAGRVDPVEQHDQHGDQEQVAIPQHQPDSAHQPGHGFAVLGRNGLGPGRYGLALRTGQQQRSRQHSGRHQHQAHR